MAGPIFNFDAPLESMKENSVWFLLFREKTAPVRTAKAEKRLKDKMRNEVSILSQYSIPI